MVRQTAARHTWGVAHSGEADCGEADSGEADWDEANSGDPWVGTGATIGTGQTEFSLAGTKPGTSCIVRSVFRFEPDTDETDFGLYDIVTLTETDLQVTGSYTDSYTVQNADGTYTEASEEITETLTFARVDDE